MIKALPKVGDGNLVRGGEGWGVVEHKRFTILFSKLGLQHYLFQKAKM